MTAGRHAAPMHIRDHIRVRSESSGRRRYDVDAASSSTTASTVSRNDAKAVELLSRRNATASASSGSDFVSGRNTTGRGAYFYVDAFLGAHVGQAGYTLKVSVARR